MRINATNLISEFEFQLTVRFASCLGKLRALNGRGEFCDPYSWETMGVESVVGCGSVGTTTRVSQGYIGVYVAPIERGVIDLFRNPPGPGLNFQTSFRKRGRCIHTVMCGINIMYFRKQLLGDETAEVMNEWDTI